MKSIQRRAFLQSSTAAAITFSATKLRAGSPNDRIQVAVVGLRGRGREHIHQFGQRKDSPVVAVCDIDATVAERAVQQVAEIQGGKPKVYGDIRRLLEDKQVDVVTIATCNHWHALAAIWACQAGKDVYLEKPGSHNIFEGRQLAEAARKYQRVVQIGLQARSIPHYRRAIELVQQGAIGKIYMARGICFKRRVSIGKRTPEPVPAGVDYDLWRGPAPERPFQANRFHYNWHWFWDTGSGDIGNQGVHEMDLARWGLGKSTLPHKIHSSGGKFIYDDDQETPNTQLATFEFDNCQLVFEVRGLMTGGEPHITQHDPNFIGNTFFGSEGYLCLNSEGFQMYRGEKRELVSHMEPAESDIWETASHVDNFLKAVRSRRQAELNCDAAEGRLSAALCHLANVSYRIGRKLAFDPMTETFGNDQEANKYLKREYRPPFVVPDDV